MELVAKQRDKQLLMTKQLIRESSSGGGQGETEFKEEVERSGQDLVENVLIPIILV